MPGAQAQIPKCRTNCFFPGNKSHSTWVRFWFSFHFLNWSMRSWEGSGQATSLAVQDAFHTYFRTCSTEVVFATFNLLWTSLQCIPPVRCQQKWMRRLGMQLCQRTDWRSHTLPLWQIGRLIDYKELNSWWLCQQLMRWKTLAITSPSSRSSKHWHLACAN